MAEYTLHESYGGGVSIQSSFFFDREIVASPERPGCSFFIWSPGQQLGDNEHWIGNGWGPYTVLFPPCSTEVSFVDASGIVGVSAGGYILIHAGGEDIRLLRGAGFGPYTFLDSHLGGNVPSLTSFTLRLEVSDTQVLGTLIGGGGGTVSATPILPHTSPLMGFFSFATRGYYFIE